ncbi:5'-3' exoribonuclease 2-like [Asparagus officinalis]|uniref:5'-3' exoribonuclease 2-like n=1 Tax=Asparagus officinalis TaxID=4686 RepID=UPI00098E2633|nr:5'-3' exoribonuclease 2-like [Asparagus officinalis]
MLVDGVAPRAKMNQQRARRFRAAKDAELAEAEEERLRKEFEKQGKRVLPKEETEVSDSNVITPGTLFMDKLAKALEYYIHVRLNSDPGWKSIKVILSDANVPGEGEHKIMSFIRLQRNLPGYNPGTHHCLYGLDADLIMLALASHEIHFSILREDVLKHERHDNSIPSLSTNFSRMEIDLVKSRQWFNKGFTPNSVIPKKPYQFVNVWTLREYLKLDMKIMDAPFDIDFERIVDDFIFICFFTGNDFLPHLPTLEIHEGAVDLLIHVYKKVFKTNGGYLVDTSRIKEKKAAYIKMKRVERFILEVGSYEDQIFKKRCKVREKLREKLLHQKLEEENNDFDKLNQDSLEHTDSVNLRGSLMRQNLEECSTSRDSNSCKQMPISSKVGGTDKFDVLQNTKELKQKLKDHLRNKSDLFKSGLLENDKVMLGNNGWKERYYKEKFSAENPTEIESIRKQILEKYVEALCWVLRYYFAGVPSWSWYYPFHYGPFASDLRGLGSLKNEFRIGKPFNPFDQLMSVLPSKSSNALPEAYRNLMTSKDSPIIKFYPQDFVVDTSGKRFSWQGVCNLPFIDEEELLTATQIIEKDLKAEEVKRNSFRHEKIFVQESHVLGLEIASIRKMSKDDTERKEINANSCEINGYISLCHDLCCTLMSNTTGTENTIEDCVLSSVFENPKYHDHIPRPLGALPEKTITEADIVERQLWHEYEGYHPPTTSQQRYTRRFEDASKSVPENARERWVAGSGWRGRGRGRGDYGAKRVDSGSGWGFVDEKRRYDQRQSRAQAGSGCGLRGSGSDNWRERSAMVNVGGRGRDGAVSFMSSGQRNWSEESRESRGW